MAIRQPRPTRSKHPTRPKWQSKYHGVRMTPDEYLALPEEKPYLEYIDGMVVQKPMPTNEHAKLALEVGSFLRDWTRRHGGSAGVEARSRLGDLPNFRLPDVSFWAPGVPSDGDSKPTLAVEIRSKDQTLAELRRKCQFLRSTGVEACWLIDPVARSAELFEGKRNGVASDVLKAECLPGFELTLAELFAVIDDQGE